MSLNPDHIAYVSSADHNPSPFEQQYYWESVVMLVRDRDGTCQRCKKFKLQWGWCPRCTPLHFRELL